MSNAGFDTLEYEEYEAEQRLMRLGLTMRGLVDVVLRGEFARAQATAHDPVTADGFDAYRHRVRALRDIYCPAGWLVGRDCGLELLVSPDGSRAVLTRAGADGVGVRGTWPQPKRAVGDATARAVENGMIFDDRWFNEPGPAAVPQRYEVWMLLVDRDGDIVFAELSKPAGTRDDGTVSGWIERILVPRTDMSGLTQDGGGEEDGSIDVPVTRKR
jgi:hypothetical protein